MEFDEIMKAAENEGKDDLKKSSVVMESEHLFIYLKNLRSFMFSKLETLKLFIKRFLRLLFNKNKPRCLRLSKKQKLYLQAKERISNEFEIERVLR